MGPVIIAGCGYVGTKLAETLQKDSGKLTAIVRTQNSSERLGQVFPTIRLDLDEETVPASMEMQGAVIFYLIAPPAHGVRDTRMERFLSSIKSTHMPAKVVLISTTGVYGNCGDDWVNEERPPRPDTDRARRRLDAETQLARWSEQRSVEYVILRVPGIYGPGKLPLKRLRESKPVLNLSESPWSNRIHIDDLVQSCVKAAVYQGPFRVFNISDGHPSSMTDFFLSVARKFDLPEPAQISLAQCRQIFSENMVSYLLESKKISNEHMLNELRVQLKYPSLQLGLQAL